MCMWAALVDGHSDVICTNQQEAVITSSPCRISQTFYWHRFEEEAPRSADLRLTPLFAHSQRTTETLSFRELSVFSQREEEEDRD